MKIGIFGGSFNPPHKMHVAMANELIYKHYVDKIIFVPTGSQYKYKTNLIADSHRYHMLELICNKNKFMEVSNLELKGEVVYTYQTLAYFKSIYPNDEIYFICGTDNLSYMDQWKNGIDILKNQKILVVKRETDAIEDILKRFQQYKDNIIVSTVEPRDISSTNIRKMLIERKENVTQYLEEDIIQYIRKEHLYEEV